MCNTYYVLQEAVKRLDVSYRPPLNLEEDKLQRVSAELSETAAVCNFPTQTVDMENDILVSLEDLG